MLTVDLVRAYRRGGQLKLSEFKPADRDRAIDLAARYLALTRAHVGQSRGTLEEALASVPFSARDKKLSGGLRKLILDRCEFEASADHDPVAIRRSVFERAGHARRAAQLGEDFDRAHILAEAAAALGLPTDQTTDQATDQATDAAALVDRLLYADLKHAHRLLRFAALSPEALFTSYCDGQAQAVLLRARRVVARVSGQPSDIRALFHKLKFLRLLYTIEKDPADGQPDGRQSYQITIDGPYSLFRSVTRYGLGLALMLPALRTCERWSLEAEIEWGKQRQPLVFHLQSQAPGADPGSDSPAPARLPDEVQALLDKFAGRLAADKTRWQATVASDILALPGVGLCVPDLLFVHQDTGECIYLEVMGFWSRDAVWRRVELIEHGLPHRIIFAVSSRLRVSEAALDPELPGALYVYKGVMSAKAIEERLERLRG